MDARRQRGIKKTSLRQERQTAADIGGRTQANSGAVRMGGGADVRGEGLRIECKFTEKGTYVLKFKELEKLRKQAIQTLEFPVFQFAFKVSNQLVKYAVISWNGEIDSTTTSWGTISLQMIIQHTDLQYRLTLGRVHIGFSPPSAGLKTYATRNFEVMRWDDFVKQFQDSTAKES